MTTAYQGWLDTLRVNPEDVAARLAYSDWCEQHEDYDEADLQRSRAYAWSWALRRSNAVLCYVSRSNYRAFFTTQALADQWGDDWNDAPWEHNAEEPYTPAHAKDFGPDGKPKWRVVGIDFSANAYELPGTWVSNSQISVERINRGVVPWLDAARYSGATVKPIMAGTPLPEFCRLIELSGGSWSLVWEGSQ